MNGCSDSSRISKQVLQCNATGSQARGLLGPFHADRN